MNESQQTMQSQISRDDYRPVTPELLIHSQLLPDSLIALQPSPSLFVPDSQADSSQESNTSSDWRRTDYTRDKRLQIQTALLFKIPLPQIKETLDVTNDQIYYTKYHRLTPQKTRAGRHAKLHIPEKIQLKEWLLSSPSHRHVAYSKIPHFLPQLGGKQAIRTAIDGINYCRRISRKKGFSDDPKVCQERLDLAEDGSTWPRLRV
ncbi:uncharacterized protein K444DRAFT_234229 [Hyaloscypha bicolor E]|uniref:Uncharacterized protein n=1 Tax=Hyaloscypha bicolor E TaxID=1095630 RepID=A0A2J6SLG1_9HELO|nr:uncharacterized protein K444DRAFT_234229 [Hyaloscypha bicolor E]PMD51560.1 hypothetical protein K444DRAFT_234229 [Hyaloscypha bicolor E]